MGENDFVFSQVVKTAKSSPGSLVGGLVSHLCPPLDLNVIDLLVSAFGMDLS